VVISNGNDLLWRFVEKTRIPVTLGFLIEKVTVAFEKQKLVIAYFLLFLAIFLPILPFRVLS